MNRQEFRNALPPGPTVPAPVQLLATWKRPAASLERLRQQYGSRVTVQLPFQPPLVILSDPAAIKDLFTAPPDVLQATARIPYGAVSTYKQVASQAGSPRGQRAAGNALGSNPIPIIVPCHRVLHSGGGLGGYTGGVQRKRVLLTVEGVLGGAPAGGS